MTSNSSSLSKEPTVGALPAADASPQRPTLEALPAADASPQRPTPEALPAADALDSPHPTPDSRYSAHDSSPHPTPDSGRSSTSTPQTLRNDNRAALTPPCSTSLGEDPVQHHDGVPQHEINVVPRRGAARITERGITERGCHNSPFSDPVNDSEDGSSSIFVEDEASSEEDSSDGSSTTSSVSSGSDSAGTHVRPPAAEVGFFPPERTTWHCEVYLIRKQLQY